MKPLTLLTVVFGLAADACLLPRELYGVRGRSLSSREPPSPEFQQLAISDRDRFHGGTSAPQSMGKNETNNVGLLLNIGEVEAGLQGLVNSFSDVKAFKAPFMTHENRTVYGAIVGEKPRVFLQSGIHARERGGPDHLLYFVGDLLRAREANTGISYGNQSYSAEDVKKASSAGLVIVPVVNPDGVAFDQESGSCWRKNRNPKSFDGNENSIGVDLNRNFAVLWDVKKLLNSDPETQVFTGSDDPNEEVFHGTGPLSEPETRNVDWVMEQHDQLSWFVDLHSFSGMVLYAWGDDDPQSTDKRQNFANIDFDGKRGLIGDKDKDKIYGEFMEEADLDAQRPLAARMGTKMSLAGEVPYKEQQTASVYPIGGASTDHAMGKYMNRTGLGMKRLQALTIEFGDDSGAECPFYPNESQYRNSMRQVGAGLMEVLLAASG